MVYHTYPDLHCPSSGSRDRKTEGSHFHVATRTKTNSTDYCLLYHLLFVFYVFYQYPPLLSMALNKDST